MKDRFRFLSGWEALCRFVSGLSPFALLSAFLIACWLPLTPHSFWYTRDTLFVFQTFYAAYNNLFLHGELAEWLPYGSYGFPFYYFQIIYFSPAQYFSAFLGWILGVRDINFLFKFSLLLEQWILLLGTYKLAQTLFRRKASVFFVSLAVIGSSLWMVQINWNFRLYAFLPLILFLLKRFFETTHPYWLWLSGLTFVFAQIGVPPYFGVYQSLVLLFFFLVEARIHPLWWHSLGKKTWGNGGLFFLFVMLASFYLYFVLHGLDSIHSSVPGRFSHSLAVLPSNFLSGDSDTGLSKFLGFLTATGFDKDTAIYMGFLSILFVLYALLTVKTRWALALGGLCLFLFCFSLGDTAFVARGIYDLFPPIRFARYIGNLSSLMRIFVLFLAGYGVDQFLTSQVQKKERSPVVSGRLIFLITAWSGLGLFLVAGLSHLVRPFIPEFSLSFFLITCFLTLIALCLLTWRPGSLHRQGVILCLFLALDLFSYHCLFLSSWPKHWQWIHPIALKVSPFPFQPKRDLKRNLNPRMKEAEKIIRQSRFCLSAEAFAFLLFDPATHRQYPNFYRIKQIHELLNLKFPEFYTAQSFEDFLNSPEISNFIAVFGVSKPKLRFVPEVLFANDHDQARELVLKAPDLRDLLILENVSPALKEHWKRFPTQYSEDTLQVRRFSFNQLSLVARVTSPHGNWLYYADAYHPDWKVWVDGKHTEVYPADLAFKALYLPPGQHRVLFKFCGGIMGFLAHAIALASVLFISVILWAIGRNFYRTAPDHSNKRDLFIHESISK